MADADLESSRRDIRLSESIAQKFRARSRQARNQRARKLTVAYLDARFRSLDQPGVHNSAWVRAPALFGLGPANHQPVLRGQIGSAAELRWVSAKHPGARSINMRAIQLSATAAVASGIRS